MPYRTRAAPEDRASSRWAPVLLVVLGLTFVHGASFIVLWISFGILHWTGENGLTGLVIRMLGSIPIVVLGWLGASTASAHSGRATGALARAVVFAAIYLAAALVLSRLHTGLRGPPLIFPRAGRISAEPDFVSLLAAAIINPGIVMIVFFGLGAVSANKRRVRERMFRRLCDAPCTKCGGRMAEDVDRLMCVECGLSTPLPSDADVEAMAKLSEPPSR